MKWKKKVDGKVGVDRLVVGGGVKEDGGGENKFGGERLKRDKMLEFGWSGEYEWIGVRGVSVDDGVKVKLGLES